MSFSVVELICKKRDGGAWSDDEVRFIVQGIVGRQVGDEQVGAICMAIYFKGMSDPEIAALTLAIAESGEQYEIGAVHRDAVEQSSTGCVGDYGDITLLPLLAACGVTIAKVSGPPLGHINSIIGKVLATGMNVYLSRDEMLRQIDKIGFALACHSDKFTPADRSIYMIRALTGTVSSFPLIASSIMSKKIAVGTPAIAVDVKYGSGTFVKEKDQAGRLAQVMQGVGTMLGRKMSVPIYEIHEPLGFAVGGALEMLQGAEILKGKGPADLRDHVIDLGAKVLLLTKLEATEQSARQRLALAISDGSGLAKFAEWINVQGGNAGFIDNPDDLAPAPLTKTVTAPRSGTIRSIDADTVGLVAVRLGAGRERRDEEIDFRAGIKLHCKTGEAVKPGQPLATLHTHKEDRLEEAAQRVLSAYAIE